MYITITLWLIFTPWHTHTASAYVDTSQADYNMRGRVLGRMMIPHLFHYKHNCFFWFLFDDR